MAKTLEQLTMQEVSKIILSVPKGVIIPGNRQYYEGEPVMIITNPGLSDLRFLARGVTAKDGRGFVGEAGITNQIDFTINEGSILYGLWSYLYGYTEDSGRQTMRECEYITVHNGHLLLDKQPMVIYLYKHVDNENIIINPDDYDVINEGDDWLLVSDDFIDGEEYLVSYTYTALADTISHMKQIHNNIICSLDIYFNAVDKVNDDKYIVCIHCDRTQVDTDMVIRINNSQASSFTPIKVTSIPQAGEDGINKDIATVTVMKYEE